MIRDPNSLILLRPHPDHPAHVVPDHVGVQGRVPVHHLTSPIALKAGHGPALQLSVGEQFSSL